MPHLGFGGLFDFREDEGSFVFQGIFHELVITFRVFSSAIFELKITEIIVDCIAAFEELIEFGAVRCKVGSIRMDVEDEEKNGGCEAKASAEGSPNRGIKEKE